MTTTSITSGTDFIGKTLIIGSTGTSNTDYARVVEFNNNTTGTYLGVMFSATNKQPWFTFRPLGQMYSEPIMPWISYINVYYIYVFSFISDTQIKYNIYEYNGASTIVSKGTIGTYTGASAFLQNLTQFWLGRSIWANDLYNGRYDKVALYNGDLFALTEANILSTLLTLVTTTQTNIINNSTTYTFRALGTNFLGVVVNILNYNTTTGSDISNTAITLISSGTTSGGYLNIIGSYLETAPISSLMSLHNFNSGNKSWKMYAHTISSISGDHLTIKPHSGRNIVLEVSANNAVFIKQGDTSHNLTNLISGSGSGIVSGSDASFANIDISGNLNPLIINGSSIGLATKNWNSAYINTIYGETLNTYRSDKTLAINSNILTISGELITSGNINPAVSGAVLVTQGTGGSVSISGGYIIHSFTTTGTSAFVPAFSGSVEVLIVGGGGGGGSIGFNGSSGGGGAGGVVYIPSVSVSAGANYPIVVGDGGASGANGLNSSAFTAIAAGGGRGGLPYPTNGDGCGNNGGSGGGAGGGNNTNIGGISSGNSPGTNSNAIIHGNNGGSMTHNVTFDYRAAGGGGAGTQGFNTNTNSTADGGQFGFSSGGDGIMYNILGPSYYWGGGGGGAGRSSIGGWGGRGGGGGGGGSQGSNTGGPGGGSALTSGGAGNVVGSGAVADRGGGNGGANTGGGGGGGSYNNVGGRGGSGIVVIRYLQSVSAPKLSSLGLSTKYWGNAYIKDISTSSIEVSGNIICSRDVSTNLGSSLRRWKHVFSDDLSVNKINGQVYGGSSSINFTSISGNIIPSINNLFRLGDVSRNWSNAYIRDASVSSIDVSLNIYPLLNNGSSLGLSTRRWGNAYIRDVSVSSIDVSLNLNPLNANGSSLGLSTKYWGNAYLRDVSTSSIDVSGNLNPLNANGSSLGLIGRTWGNAYIRDLSVSSIDVSSNSISPFVNNSASLGAPNKAWGNAYIRDVSISSIDVSGNLNPLTSNTLTLGLPTRVWGNAYIRDLSISSIDVSSNTISPFLNNRSSLGIISKTWGNAYLRDVSVSNIDISQNLNPLVSGTSTVSVAQGTGGTVTISGGYIIHSFTTTGTSAFVPVSSGSVEVLIVGGGGGGGNSLGGGGGGGGVIWIPATNVILGTSYEVVVGDGGASQTNGQLSRAFGATAAGGGTSAGYDRGVGTAGGSGGGAAAGQSILNQGGGTSGNILGTNNGINNVGTIYGNIGGRLIGGTRATDATRAAGGGGAGAQGLDTDMNITGDTGQTGAGSGGAGIVNPILGPSHYWGGGGGGGAHSFQFGGWGGLGGGGGGAGGSGQGNGGGGTGGRTALVDGSNGGVGNNMNGGNGGTNTGGGGGGGNWSAGQGGRGGSGIVVIRYLQGTSGSGGSNLGSALKRWKNIFVGDLSVNTINGLPYGGGGGGAASIVYSTGGSAIVNSSIVSNMIPSITNTYSLGSTSRYWNNAYINNLRASNRAYQEISGDISWSAVNGHYGLAKDAYPGLNPSSSGVKAVQTWTNRTVPNTTILCRGVCWSPELGLFVAVAESGPNRVMTSPDGITWTARTAASENRWYSVCWSKELRIFVAVSRDIKVMTSVDGITWIPKTPANGAGVSVCWSPELGLFVAVSDNAVARSSDGTTWFSSVGIPEGAYLSVCWSPQLRLFIAGSVNFTRLISSSDGITWATITGAPSGQWTSICWSPELGLFVAVGFAGVAVITSSDGIVWTERTPSTYGLGWFGVCWSRELEIFVAVSITGTNNTRVMTSPNGITWTTRAAGGTDWWYGVCWSPELGIFAAVGTGPTNIVMTSSLKGRPPTSYNVFDSSFNSIDENGKWNFLNIAISGTMTAGSTNVTSDDRLKHNEVGIANGLAIIDQLNPKFYQKTQTMLDTSYNGDLSGYAWTYEAGLIAQEVLQVPDLSFVVSGGDYYETVMNYELSYNILSSNDLSSNDLSSNDLSYNDLSYNDLSYTLIYYESGKYLINQIYGVNYNSLLTYGLAAIKELHAKVKAQDLSLLEQQATINSLTARLEALEASANTI